MLLSDSLSKNVCLTPKKNISDDIILNKLINNVSAQKPKLVSVGTQSPKFMPETSTPGQSAPTQQSLPTSQTKPSSNYSTPVATIETKSSTAPVIPIMETPKVSSKFSSNLPSQNQENVKANIKKDNNSFNLANLLFSDNNVTSIFPTSKNSNLFGPKQSGTTNVQAPARAINTDSPLAVTNIKSSTTNVFSLAKVVPAISTPSISSVSKITDSKSTKAVADLTIHKQDTSMPSTFTFKPTTPISNASTTISTTNVTMAAPVTSTAKTMINIQAAITTLTSSSTATPPTITNSAGSNSMALNFSFKPTASLESNVITNTTPNVIPSTPFSSGLTVSNIPLNSSNATSVNFTFKPPNATQSATTFSQPTANDEGMDDDLGNALGGPITFDFNK